MRLFIAITPPAELRERIWMETKELRRIREVRWLDPGALHLTLKFLGEVEEDRGRHVASALTRVARPVETFSLTIGRLGAFPDGRRPRVVWVGVDAAQPLTGLRDELERALEGLGFAPEQRPFAPHITVGRVRRGREVPAERLADLVAPLNIDATWRVEGVELVRSRLKPSGAVYETMEFARFAGGNQRST